MAEFALQILSGVQVGRKVPISGKVTLGRSADNDIVFTGPDGSLVSGHHAEILPKGSAFLLRDLGSTNGIYVDGERIEECELLPENVFSLGVSGPKLRLVDRAHGTHDATGSRPGSSAGSKASQRRSFPQDAKQARTELEAGKEERPKAAKSPKDKPRLGGPGFTGDDPGGYTMGLAQRLKDDEADSQEIQALIRDQGRSERIVKSGMLSRRDSMMIQNAASTFSIQRKRAWVIIGSIVLIAVVVVSGLLYQNMGYRGKLKQQARLVANVRDLEGQLAEARQAGGGPSLSPEQLHENEELVAKLRAAERQLMNVRGNLRSQDLISTYKNPLGREIHTILEGFGKRDYIVPDIFISQVEKHIHTFTKTSIRSIIDRSLRNKDKYHAIIEAELNRQGMPIAFLYLAMHESTLDSAIISRAGARGLWQFMPATAREYGLRVPANWEDLPAEEDQRTDPRLSTQAGVKYVKTLYAEFGDVALAMAAYNAGEGRIRKALRSIDDPINNRDFWYIYRLGILADETNQYVPKIIATMIIDKNRARYGF